MPISRIRSTSLIREHSFMILAKSVSFSICVTHNPDSLQQIVVSLNSSLLEGWFRVLVSFATTDPGLSIWSSSIALASYMRKHCISSHHEKAANSDTIAWVLVTSLQACIRYEVMRVNLALSSMEHALTYHINFLWLSDVDERDHLVTWDSYFSRFISPRTTLFYVMRLHQIFSLLWVPRVMKLHLITWLRDHHVLDISRMIMWQLCTLAGIFVLHLSFHSNTPFGSPEHQSCLETVPRKIVCQSSRSWIDGCWEQMRELTCECKSTKPLTEYNMARLTNALFVWEPSEPHPEATFQAAMITWRSCIRLSLTPRQWKRSKGAFCYALFHNQHFVPWLLQKSSRSRLSKNSRIVGWIRPQFLFWIPSLISTSWNLTGELFFSIC